MNDVDVRSAFEKKKLIIIGVSNEELENDPNGYDGATSLNHEEDSHARDDLAGNPNDLGTDHFRYFGAYGFYSPSHEDIKNNPRYNNTPARKASNEILYQIF